MKKYFFCTSLLLFFLFITPNFIHSQEENTGKQPQTNQNTDKTFEVVDILPKGKISSNLDTIVVSFSKPVVALGNYNSIDNIIDIEPKIKGYYRWLDQSHLAFVVDDNLDDLDKLKVTVNKDIKSLDDSSLIASKNNQAEIILDNSKYLKQGCSSENTYTYNSLLQPTLAVTTYDTFTDQQISDNMSFLYKNKQGKEIILKAELVSKPKDYTFQNNLKKGKKIFFVRPEQPLNKNSTVQIILKKPGFNKPLDCGEIETYKPLKYRDSLTGNDGDPKIIENEETIYPSINKNTPIQSKMSFFLDFNNLINIDDFKKSIVVHNNFKGKISIRAFDDYYTQQDLDELKELYKADEIYDKDEKIKFSKDFLIEIPFDYKSQQDSINTTVKLPVKDIYNQELINKTLAFTGKIPPLKSIIDVYPQCIDYNTCGIFQLSDKLQLALFTFNQKSVEITGYLLDPQQTIEFMSMKDMEPYYNSSAHKELERTTKKEKFLSKLKPYKKTINITNNSKDIGSVTVINFSDIFGKQDITETVLLDFSENYSGYDDLYQHFNNKDQRLYNIYQRTNLVINSKIGIESSLFWVTDSNTGKNIENVTLEAYNPKTLEKVWSGKTDKSGFFIAQANKDLKEVDDLYLLAKYKEQSFISNIYLNNSEGRNNNYLISALPVYKPGETAKFKAIFRQLKDNQLKNIKYDNVGFIIYNPLGDKIADISLPANSDYSTSDFDFKIPADANLGSWTIYYVAKANGDKKYSREKYLGSFEVAYYKEPSFLIDFINFPISKIIGEEINFKIEAKYFFGLPVNNASLEYVVSKIKSYNPLEKITEYKLVNDADLEFIDEVKTFNSSDYEIDSESSSIETTGKHQLNQNGSYEVNYKIKDKQKLPEAFIYTFFTTIEDIDKRTVSHTKELIVHPAEMYVGLKTSENFVKKDQPMTIGYAVFDLDGNFVENRDIEINIYKRTWSQAKAKFIDSFYNVAEKNDEKIDTIKVTSQNKPASFQFTPKDGGTYIAIAKITDLKGKPNESSITFYSSSDEYISSENNEEVIIIPDKKSYKIGDTAKIMIHSPYKKVRGLLTTEVTDIIYKQQFDIDNFSTVIEIPIIKEYAPNAVVSITLMHQIPDDKKDPNKYSPPKVLEETFSLSVDDNSNLYKVQVNVSNENCKPGEEIEVSIEVKDQQGNPVNQAELLVLAVDQAVMQLTGSNTYYPSNFFQEQRYLYYNIITMTNAKDMFFGYNYAVLKGGTPLKAKKAAFGGGGGLSLHAIENLRKNFTPLAYYEPNIQLDKNGQAKVKVKLPDNLTTYQIYAIAIGNGSKAGTGTKNVTISKNLLLRSALPPFLGAYDTLMASTLINNLTSEDQQVKVKLTGEGFKLLDKEEKTILVKAKSGAEVDFKIQADPGKTKAQFIFQASSDKYSDAAKYELDIINPNKLEKQSSFLILEPGKKNNHIDIALPPDTAFEEGGLNINLAPSLIIAMKTPLEWLKDYQHLCVEQQTSKAYATLIRLGMENRWPFDNQKDKKQAAEYVNKHLAKLKRWQKSSGEFNFWPESNQATDESYDIFVTAYVLDFLTYAQNHGYKVDEAVIDRARNALLAYAKSIINKNIDKIEYNFFGFKNAYDFNSYIVYIFSNMKQDKDFDRTNQYLIESLYNSIEKISPDYLPYLLVAISRQNDLEGKDEKIKNLLSKINNNLNNAMVPGNYKNKFEKPLNSHNASIAIIALSEVDPSNANIVKLLTLLLKKNKSGQFGTTQNNIRALLAFKKFIDTFENKPLNVQVKTFLNNTLLNDSKFIDYTNSSVSINESLSKIGDKATISYQLEGEGCIYANNNLLLKNRKPTLEATSSANFLIYRNYEKVEDINKIDTKNIEVKSNQTTFNKGDMVKVTITVLSRGDINYAVLEEKLPSGLEPINTNFKTSDSRVQVISSKLNSNWYNHVEMWPDKIALYSNYMYYGNVYTYTYFAMAATKGTFAVSGPTIEEMYDSEKFARGEGAEITIK